MVANKLISLGFRGAMAAFVALAMVAILPDSASAQTGIRNTKHNLSSGNTNTADNRSNQGEICVFCHTPHGSATTAAAPLWNKVLSGAATYTAYDSTTLDGTVDLTNSVSLACLTCHDGTQAMDTVLNAPGSGGYNASGARISGITWTAGTGTPVVTGTGVLGSGVANLGTDLSNDHPVGIQYAKSSAGTLDSDFTLADRVGTTDRWYLDTGATGGTSGSRDRRDVILYTKSSLPYVECASCHDPHTDENATFLRISNDESALCLTCHVK